MPSSSEPTEDSASRRPGSHPGGSRRRQATCARTDEPFDTESMVVRLPEAIAKEPGNGAAIGRTGDLDIANVNRSDFPKLQPSDVREGQLEGIPLVAAVFSEIIPMGQCCPM